MAEYIDREALLKTIFPYDVADKSEYAINAKAVEKAIKGASTADVVEVRRGYWIHEPPYIAPNGNYLKASECSNCHAVFVSNGNEPYSDHPYCCECGAKMDGERNRGDWG